MKRIFQVAKWSIWILGNAGSKGIKLIHGGIMGSYGQTVANQTMERWYVELGTLFLPPGEKPASWFETSVNLSYVIVLPAAIFLCRNGLPANHKFLQCDRCSKLFAKWLCWSSLGEQIDHEQLPVNAPNLSHAGQLSLESGVSWGIVVLQLDKYVFWDAAPTESALGSESLMGNISQCLLQVCSAHTTQPANSRNWDKDNTHILGVCAQAQQNLFVQKPKRPQLPLLRPGLNYEGLLTKVC